MKLSELTYHDGPPSGEIDEGMVLRYLNCKNVCYGVVGFLRPTTESKRVNDIGCGCCSESYKVTGWAWLGGEPVED
jgi:hypothetical protein